MTKEVVLLRGASLLHADTLVEIATLGDDGQWRTPDGVITDAIGLPEQAARAIVKPEHARAAHREQDAAWVKQALVTVRDLALCNKEVTVDDCWSAVVMPPRKPSVMSTLMVAAGREGLIEKTARHRGSIRPINGGRTVRVWRSRIYTDRA
ncbi:MAG: hypothetical protein ACRDK7_15130 [Solirubrobacteraceae bacterium]